MFKIENPYLKPTNPDENDRREHREYDAFNEGIKALIKWLFGKCTEHPIRECSDMHDDMNLIYYPEHRYECPVCMKELVQYPQEK